MSDSEIVVRIHQLMDGTEWSADTLQAIAHLLASEGYTIHSPEYCTCDAGGSAGCPVHDPVE